MSIRDLDFWLNEKELKTPKHDEMVLWTFNHAEEIIKLILEHPSEKEFKDRIKYVKEIDYRRTMEYPLKSKTDFNIGFLDLLVQVLRRNKFDEESSYYDLLFQIAFEIKPEVKSIGEVLRQFQFYKSNLQSNTRLILVTGTKGLKEIFESQGFYVIEYGGLK
jgi:hypothetical protein